MEQVLREKNHREDVLANIAAVEGQTLPKGVPLQLIPRPSITKGIKVNPVERLLYWMEPIADYLQSDILLEDPDQARKLKRTSIRYYLVEGYLYRKGRSFPLIRCLHLDDAQWAMN